MNLCLQGLGTAQKGIERENIIAKNCPGGSASDKKTVECTNKIPSKKKSRPTLPVWGKLYQAK